MVSTYVKISPQILKLLLPLSDVILVRVSELFFCEITLRQGQSLYEHLMTANAGGTQTCIHQHLSGTSFVGAWIFCMGVKPTKTALML